MKRALLISAFVWAHSVSLRADTVYQTNPEGKQFVIQRDAIVVRDDSSALVYKHFELKERRVVKVSLNKGSQPYTVSLSDAADHQRIVEKWRRFGFKADVTDRGGKTTRISDAYLDFYPPGGRGSLLEAVPAKTEIPVLLDAGGTKEIDFSDISRIEFRGDRLRVTLRTGEATEGRFLLPTEKPAEARFLGITDRYDPTNQEVFDFSALVTDLREVRFVE